MYSKAYHDMPVARVVPGDRYRQPRMTRCRRRVRGTTATSTSGHLRKRQPPVPNRRPVEPCRSDRTERCIARYRPRPVVTGPGSSRARCVLGRHGQVARAIGQWFAADEVNERDGMAAVVAHVGSSRVLVETSDLPTPVDEDVREEYWRNIRKRPQDVECKTT